MATISDEEHRTSTVVDDLWPPTNVTEAPAEDCDDPEQACYYAHLLRVVNVLDLYLLPLISVVGSKSGSQFASAPRSEAGSRSKSRSRSDCVSGKVERSRSRQIASSDVSATCCRFSSSPPPTCVDCPAASTWPLSPSSTPSFYLSYSAAH